MYATRCRSAAPLCVCELSVCVSNCTALRVSRPQGDGRDARSLPALTSLNLTSPSTGLSHRSQWLFRANTPVPLIARAREDDSQAAH